MIDDRRGNDQTPEVWTVMLTPFTVDKRIDWEGVDRLTDWYIEAGCAGLFTVSQSSEMFDLSAEERLALAERVVHGATGRAPVVATGTFGGAVEEQAEFVKRTADTGVDAVVCLVNQLASQGESNDVWKANAEALLKATGEIPLGLYECPKPYHRLISPSLLAWAASTGRFLFLKETSARMELIEAKIAAARGSSLRFYNANTWTLLTSLRSGGDGFCGIGANFYPDLFVWLCNHFSEQPEAAEKLQRFLTIAQELLKHKYPASAKQYLSLCGMEILPTCRVHHDEWDEEEIGMLAALTEVAHGWREKLGILDAPGA
jgi:4-hydroxy-tetrahydrodipicolinate synthase